MVSLEVVAILLSGIGITVSLFYYSNVLNNANKTQQMQLETRQASILMNLYNTFRSPEFVKNWDHVVFRFEFDDWEDAFRKIHPIHSPEERTIWFSTGMFFEGLGVLVKRGLIDLPLVDDLLGNLIIGTWEKMGPVEKESRVRLQNESIFDDFEFLYDEILTFRGIQPGSSNIHRDRVKHYAEETSDKNR